MKVLTKSLTSYGKGKPIFSFKTCKTASPNNRKMFKWHGLQEITWIFRIWSYIDIRNERFVDKTFVLALSDVTWKVLFLSFELKSNESAKSKPSKENVKAKFQGIAHKQVDIDKLRFTSMSEILQFDLEPRVLFEVSFNVKARKTPASDKVGETSFIKRV